jgi:hypothetical protein
MRIDVPIRVQCSHRNIYSLESGRLAGIQLRETVAPPMAFDLVIKRAWPYRSGHLLAIGGTVRFAHIISYRNSYARAGSSHSAKFGFNEVVNPETPSSLGAAVGWPKDVGDCSAEIRGYRPCDLDRLSKVASHEARPGNFDHNTPSMTRATTLRSKDY